MRDWPIPWHLESLVYLDLFASMSLQARSGLRYLDSLFTLGLVKLIRPQVIKAIKYGNVPRKLIKKKQKKETKKLAFSEIRLFLENHLLEFRENWHEDT